MKYQAVIFTASLLGILITCAWMNKIDRDHKHENVVCDLPEEYVEISKDSCNPTSMIAYYSGKKIVFGFKH